jgi:hypothetical protein
MRYSGVSETAAGGSKGNAVGKLDGLGLICLGIPPPPGQAGFTRPRATAVFRTSAQRTRRLGGHAISRALCGSGRRAARRVIRTPRRSRVPSCRLGVWGNSADVHARRLLVSVNAFVAERKIHVVAVCAASRALPCVRSVGIASKFQNPGRSDPPGRTPAPRHTHETPSVVWRANMKQTPDSVESEMCARRAPVPPPPYPPRTSPPPRARGGVRPRRAPQPGAGPLVRGQRRTRGRTPSARGGIRRFRIRRSSRRRS